jgi:hypothetical protein
MATNQKHKDPWHFSHLDKKYFLKISDILGVVDIRNAKIEDIFIGCTGVEYTEIHNGRQINPNWCVRMKSGEEIRYGTITKNQLESGLWNLGRCNHFKWAEIVDFYK